MSDGEARRRDLMLLVPDAAYVQTLEPLLRRTRSLGIRSISFDFEVVFLRDPGCLNEAAEFLRRSLPTHELALVLFDRTGCGKEATAPEELERMVEHQLATGGWRERSAAVVVDPEIEAWVWSDSPEVDRVLGWAGRRPGLREWLRRRGLWAEGSLKPIDPKAAFEEALRAAGKGKSTRVFRELASCVGVRRCTDRAFNRLCGILRRWFPAD